MDKKLQYIINRISTHIEPTKIYLFGSRARGDATYGSDYDILIIYDGQKSKRQVELDIYKLFNYYDFSMDLFFLTSDEFNWMKPVANTIAREVNENGIVVYE